MNLKITAMKTEILIVENINEKTTGMTCFYAEPFVANAIHDAQPFQGVVIIDGTVVKFSFWPTGMDGDIFTTNAVHRLIVKTLVPLYAYAKVKGE